MKFGSSRIYKSWLRDDNSLIPFHLKTTFKDLQLLTWKDMEGEIDATNSTNPIQPLLVKVSQYSHHSEGWLSGRAIVIRYKVYEKNSTQELG